MTLRGLGAIKTRGESVAIILALVGAEPVKEETTGRVVVQGAEHSSCRLERFLQQVDEGPHFVPRIVQDERMQIQKMLLLLVLLDCDDQVMRFVTRIKTAD